GRRVVEEARNRGRDLAYAHRAGLQLTAVGRGGLAREIRLRGPLAGRAALRGPGLVLGIEVQRVVRPARVLDLRIAVEPGVAVRRIRLLAAGAGTAGRRVGALERPVDTARRRHVGLELQARRARLRADVDVAVRMDAPVERHGRARGDLEVHALAVEDAELEEGHGRELEDPREVGARARLAGHLRRDRVRGPVPEATRVRARGQP